ncbi:MAG: UDP-N-acetylglucosamine 2-epimerase (non-hydrolyzing) [Candidatus Pacebacteria bacterium]|nr:UDP-N-acetylglucosamine 2-epimerase (non-hydrolyzing) [Candidatus Paceibacterota bacterium]
MKIALIAGARPNFMKVAPLCHELKKQNLKYFLVNTGQHFSMNMSKNFFDEFDIQPDYSFSPSCDSVTKQFSDISNSLEEVFVKETPSLVIVFGDVNSTLAAGLVANKMKIQLAHVEAGLRSYNRLMPEETNRVLVDHMADVLLVTSEDGVDNLKKEGITENVFFIGNIMIDTLKSFLPFIKTTKEIFYFTTIHRAENIDDKKTFNEILDALEEISKDAPIFLPLHPRTKKMSIEFGIFPRLEKIFHLVEPLSYTESLYYQKNAKLILTDSGGVQEESSYLGTPCITLRTETERPVTVSRGTNIIGGVTKRDILSAYKRVDFMKKDIKIPLWDGKTSERIVQVIKNIHNVEQ